MSDVEIVEKNRFLSSVWMVPLLAIAVGIWMVVDGILSEGPKIKIRFATAEGLSAGETRIKRLSVDLGIVEEVYLNDGFDDVTAVVALDAGTENLLRQDTLFWVVRPRIGATGISGLSTLLSGAYIELSPGEGAPGRREFEGLEDAPATSRTTPGMALKLVAERAGSISAGSPVLYNGYTVGKVESTQLSTQDRNAHYDIFVNAPYDDLISANTKFWNASGLQMDAGVDGVSVHTESLDALITGGIAFGLMEGESPGGTVSSGQTFTLYKSEQEIYDNPKFFGQNYLLLFDSSIRGLKAGAPVEYRGARLGTVISVSFDLLEDDQGLTDDGRPLMPVLIRIEPGRLGEESQAALDESHQQLAKAVKQGLRASLATGNLITGSLFVNLDFYEPDEKAELTVSGDWTLFPTATTGFEQIERQISDLLKKLDKMPMEDAVVAATGALQNISTAMKSADVTLGQVNEILEQPETRAIPASINQALVDLDGVLKSLQPDSELSGELHKTLQELQITLKQAEMLMQRVEAKPNSLIFSGAAPADPVPTLKR